MARFRLFDRLMYVSVSRIEGLSNFWLSFRLSHRQIYRWRCLVLNFTLFLFLNIASINLFLKYRFNLFLGLFSNLFIGLFLQTFLHRFLPLPFILQFLLVLLPPLLILFQLNLIFFLRLFMQLKINMFLVVFKLFPQLSSHFCRFHYRNLWKILLYSFFVVHEKHEIRCVGCFWCF